MRIHKNEKGVVLTIDDKGDRREPDQSIPTGLITKICTICDGEFITNRKNKNICSFDCKQEHNRQHAKEYARLRRYGGERKIYKPCIICGFSETTDMHRENGKVYVLCPNHRCLITRNITTLIDLLVEKGQPNLKLL